MSHYGRELSEPMCLGLGMPLNFFYMRARESSPTRMILGRNPALEEDFFRNVDIEAPIRRHLNAADAWPPVKAVVDAGHPVMLQADICHLPYYNTKVHFGGHKILLVGYDEDQSLAFISDSEFPEIQTITLDQLGKARYDPAVPWDLRYQWWDIPAEPRMAPLEQAVPRAISGAAPRMVRDQSGLFGLPSMRRLQKDLPRWEEAPDWSWCARFGYQAIEKRGTGGASFRTKYAEFFKEAEPYDKRISMLNLARRMEEIAAQWSDFAMLLKVISERDAPVGFGEAARLFGEIADAEENFFMEIDRYSI
jgi:hypothetical protein